ncbi:DUF2946 domain-containing protein [Dyella halodurans]|uniref:DUF2946 domain-containing protein n=1 Tax=Dyella halodurans TaxID=1920171 RepID=A0ABV9BWX9_9GAMM
MVALWLTIVAPVISQSLAVDSMPGMVGCESQHAHPDPTVPPSHPSSMEKCGYCGLLGHSPALIGHAVPLPHPAPARWHGTAALPARLQTEYSALAAAPRGPPAFTQH